MLIPLCCSLIPTLAATPSALGCPSAGGGGGQGSGEQEAGHRRGHTVELVLGPVHKPRGLGEEDEPRAFVPGRSGGS